MSAPHSFPPLPKKRFSLKCAIKAHWKYTRHVKSQVNPKERSSPENCHRSTLLILTKKKRAKSPKIVLPAHPHKRKSSPENCHNSAVKVHFLPSEKNKNAPSPPTKSLVKSLLKKSSVPQKCLKSVCPLLTNKRQKSQTPAPQKKSPVPKMGIDMLKSVCTLLTKKN